MANLVFDSGLARVKRPNDLLVFIREQVYRPEYSTELIAETTAA